MIKKINSNGLTLKECGECHKEYRKLYNNKCWNCYMKGKIKIPNTLTINQALNRVYKVNTYFTRGGNLRIYLNLPQAFIGKKVKLIIVEDKDETKR